MIVLVSCLRGLLRTAVLQRTELQMAAKLKLLSRNAPKIHGRSRIAVYIVVIYRSTLQCVCVCVCVTHVFPCGPAVLEEQGSQRSVPDRTGDSRGGDRTPGDRGPPWNEHKPDIMSGQLPGAQVMFGFGSPCGGP